MPIEQEADLPRGVKILHDPVRNKNVSGFLPVEREWIGKFIDSGFIDSFRFFNKDPHHYTWWSYRANARANNKGWRIDYAMVTQPLQEKINNRPQSG